MILSTLLTIAVTLAVTLTIPAAVAAEEPTRPAGGHAFAADEPKGFADLAWGAGLDDVNEHVFRLKCGPIRAAVGDPRPMCSRYELDGIGTVVVGLDFTTGDLQGYSITVPNAKAWDFRNALEQKFGKPQKVAPRISSWTWASGSMATYVEQTPLGSMLVVSTKKAILQSGKDSQQKADAIKKGF